MKLTILGASGKTGIPLVEQALAKGHHVTALVRTPTKLPIQHPNLTVIQGDVTNAADIEKVIRGADVVLSVIGHIKGSPPHLQENATHYAISAMKKHGVDRIISLTGAGVRVPQDAPKPIDHFIGFLLNTLSRTVAEDARAHYKVLQQSDVGWTMVRGPRLNDGAHTRNYQTGYVGKTSGTQVSRANVADFMLTIAETGSHLRDTPLIWES